MLKYHDLLSFYIENSGLSLGEISLRLKNKKIEISKSYISKLKNGSKPPASEELNRALAEITGGDPEQLIIAGYLEKAPAGVKEKFSHLYVGDKNEVDNREVPEKQLVTFSERLAKGIKSSELSIQEISEQCKVTTEYLEALMHKPKKIPGIRTLYTLADIFGVTPDYLGGYVNEPTGRSPETPKPKDLKELLNEEVMFDGIPVTDDSKQRILGFMESMFWDAKQKNKRKK